MKKLLLLFCVGLTACGTIAPPLPLPDNASENHSGIFAHELNPDGSVKYQWWLAQDRNTYNEFIKIYGTTAFPVPISADDHLVVDGKYWRADSTAIRQYTIMFELSRKPKQ